MPSKEKIEHFILTLSPVLFRDSGHLGVCKTVAYFASSEYYYFIPT